MSCRMVKQTKERVKLFHGMKTSASLYHSGKKGDDVQMRSDLSIKYMLAHAAQSTVRSAFYKRKFRDDFTEEEMVKVKEIDRFLKEVNLHRNAPMFEDKRIRYTCIIFRATYYKKDGTCIECFVPKYINQEDFEYKKIPYFVAKCIYRLSQKRCIEVFYTVNTLRALPNDNNKYIPERKRDNIFSSSSLYVDLDLPSELSHLSNSEILSLIKQDYEELFINIPPSLILRSGGGCHLYYSFEESYYLKTEEQLFFYMNMLKTLQQLFENYGADVKCVDCVRILRVPNSKNRKPKYGADGKDISIIYSTGERYDVQELEKKLKFLKDGGMTGLCESVLESMMYGYEEKVAEESEQEETEQEVLEEVLEEKIEKLELKPKPYKVSANVQKLIDFGYKGVQPFYDYSGETYYQAKDMMCWLQNREYHEGVRNNMLFFFNYIWFVYNRTWTYDAMLERSQKLNTYFNPQLSQTELEKAVRNNFNNLNAKKHFNCSIRNTTIQRYLHFTEEEKKTCCIGLYYETYAEYLEASRQKKMQYSKDRYTKELEKEGKIRRTERKEMFKELLKENPLMTIKEFQKITGLSRASYDVYKREIGNTKEKHFQKQKDYYLQPFKSNEKISRSEYKKLLGCSDSTYTKYKNIFLRGE